ncbi:DEAD-box ATP-dependent RNA helicase [Campylobacter blaseri]|uniref:DEAD/DEAH box helicase n=1 Tax=Campylobacter blaseri TaxID=2042961 RepID=A0A2P8R3G7_9BACT|nr:DEAD/DEAH box helicase [Campylobacter blaseri]PSM53037.1 DEAD/DEAH box helicase [Campylobacter blaseri]PSM54504.1 DEAD/DEAH box helicase [Campylobacter blaseri]QKF85248.1 DEAD-box ATP-dependent RNA helicase [Campylobacter blaseri]
MLIQDLNLIQPIQKALISEGYTNATPIQEKAIPELLKGRDLLGCAQTGTGKTAAFSIPILQSIATKQKTKGKKSTKALIIAPTRELVVQISNSLKAYGKNLELSTTAIYGGVDQRPQTRMLAKGVEIIVATPGRLLDLVNQRFIDLSMVEHFVLDEADMMLDMGMLEDVKKIIQYLPKDKQTILFSATMPSQIERLANNILNDPLKIVVKPTTSTLDQISQEFYYVDRDNKSNLLIKLLEDKDIFSAIVFSKTKHGADKIVKQLKNLGIMADAIHGDKSQSARQFALNKFKQKRTRVLVATDIAARGIDVSELSHVINYDLPEVAETYVHRIGRTGRASNEGTAISFCCHAEKPLLASIKKLTGRPIVEITGHDFPLMDRSYEEKRGRGKRSTSKSNYSNDTRKTTSSRDNSSSKKRKFNSNKSDFFDEGGRDDRKFNSRKSNSRDYASRKDESRSSRSRNYRETSY